MIELIVILFTTLGISFMCSVLEAGLLSLSLTDIAQISETKPRVAEIWRGFRENVQKPIAIILIINTFAHTIGATLSGARFDALYGHRWIVVFSVAFSLVMVQWTEILPKTLGVRYNRVVARASAYPLRALITLFTPLVALVELINKPFIGGINRDRSVDALSEISVLTRFAALNRIISGDQAKILSRTLNISKMKVRDAMIRRSDIRYLTADMTLADALIEAHVHHHTRLPLVKDDDFSEVYGYINFKDIVSALQINPEDPSLKGICRPILICNENDELNVIFNRLSRGYQHIALVMDHSRAVTGLITLEDVIEEIVGDLIDEYDVLPAHMFQVTRTRRVAGGGLSASEMKLRLGIEIPVDAGNLSEWIIERFGMVPRAGDRFSHGGHIFIVKKISRGNIFEVIIEEETT